MAVLRDDAAGSHVAHSRLPCLPSGRHRAGRRRGLTSLQNAPELSDIPQDLVRRLGFTLQTDPMDVRLRTPGALRGFWASLGPGSGGLPTQDSSSEFSGPWILPLGP
jgi:hypothetical protein